MRLLTFALCVAVMPLQAGSAAADGHTGAPAVYGFNAKVSGEGGIYDDEGAGLALGSITAPLGQRWGYQVDGAAGFIDNDAMGGGGLHLFTRRPALFLLGGYGSYHSWNSLDIGRLGAEAELYLGQFTFSSVSGWERLEMPSTLQGIPVPDRTHSQFFTISKLSWYPSDNLRFSGGYHREVDEDFGSAAFEWMPSWTGRPMSFFGTGYFGDDDHRRATFGVRLYFGADRGKSLIRRHREEDPTNYTPVFMTTEAMIDMAGMAALIGTE